MKLLSPLPLQLISKWPKDYKIRASRHHLRKRGRRSCGREIWRPFFWTKWSCKGKKEGLTWKDLVFTERWAAGKLMGGFSVKLPPPQTPKTSGQQLKWKAYVCVSLWDLSSNPPCVSCAGWTALGLSSLKGRWHPLSGVTRIKWKRQWDSAKMFTVAVLITLCQVLC